MTQTSAREAQIPQLFITQLHPALWNNLISPLSSALFSSDNQQLFSASRKSTDKAAVCFGTCSGSDQQTGSDQLANTAEHLVAKESNISFKGQPDLQSKQKCAADLLLSLSLLFAVLC